MTDVFEATQAEAIAQTTVFLLSRAMRRLWSEVVPERGATATEFELAELRHYLSEGFARAQLSRHSVSAESSRSLSDYLAAPEFTTWLDHVLSALLVGRANELRPVLNEEYHHGLALHGFSAPEDIALATAVLEHIWSVCEGALDKSAVTDLRADAVHVTTSAYLAAINRALERLAGTTYDDLAEYRRFLDRYRAAILNDCRTIVPPNFDERQRVDIDRLYVAPTLTMLGSAGEDSRSITRGLHVSELIAELDRGVVLGDPGGGKSTLTTKIGLELARGCRAVSATCQIPLLPFIIVLRDYATFRRDFDGSIVQYIESRARSTYQLEPPPGAIEWTLDTGRCLVIFDGLDELLDTSFRQEVTRSVESFAIRFPQASILVTSRKIGYRQAPLDPKMFETFQLSEFSEAQVAEYVEKWFKLDSSLSDKDVLNIVESFLRESDTVRDIRSNPLLLSLMCTIYKGEAYIPRNRPEVYEKCALMLFDRWDRGRGLREPLPFEAHIDPAMKDLAFWIYGDDRLQSGVTESQLVERAAIYLERELFTNAHQEAVAAARQFVEFCRGRAWVFTDTGTTPSGERLFQFTHRTFLEYFTAAHIAVTAHTESALMRVLLPHIRRGEWDVVAQLAIQMFARSHGGSAASLLQRMLRDSQQTRRSTLSRTTVVSFALRCLRFLVPPRSVAEAVVVEALRALDDLYDDPSRPRRDTAVAFASHDMLESIEHTASDNRVAVLKALETVRASLGDPLSDVRVERLTGALTKPTLIDGDSSKWLREHVFSESSGLLFGDITALGSTRLWAAVWLFYSNAISGSDFFAVAKLSGMFMSADVPGTNASYVPMAGLLVRDMMQACTLPLDPPRDVVGLADALHAELSAQSLGEIVLPDPGKGSYFPSRLLGEIVEGSKRPGIDSVCPFSPEHLCVGAWLFAASTEMLGAEARIAVRQSLSEATLGWLSHYKALLERGLAVHAGKRGNKFSPGTEDVVEEKAYGSLEEALHQWADGRRLVRLSVHVDTE